MIHLARLLIGTVIILILLFLLLMYPVITVSATLFLGLLGIGYIIGYELLS